MCSYVQCDQMIWIREKNEYVMWICGIRTIDMNREKDLSIIHVEVCNRYDLYKPGIYMFLIDIQVKHMLSICCMWLRFTVIYVDICWRCDIDLYVTPVYVYTCDVCTMDMNMWNLCNGYEYVIYVLWIWICNVRAMDMNTWNMCNWYECEVMLEIYG